MVDVAIPESISGAGPIVPGESGSSISVPPALKATESVVAPPVKFLITTSLPSTEDGKTIEAPDGVPVIKTMELSVNVKVKLLEKSNVRKFVYKCKTCGVVFVENFSFNLALCTSRTNVILVDYIKHTGA